MSQTDLLYSEVEEQLRASVRALLAARAPWREVLARTESGDTCDTGLWRELSAGLGCGGLAVPETLGGAGASWREAAVAAEECGRAVAPVPFLGSAVIATAALLAAVAGESAGEGAELVKGLASGERTAVLAVPFAAAPGGPPQEPVSATEGKLSGRVAGVADAVAADTLLVPAGGLLWQVPASAARVTAVTSLDMTRQLCDIELSAGPGQPVGDAAAAVRAGLLAGAALLASEQLGLAERCLELTVEHLKTRYQFGRPVGSYQGLKHRLADLWVAITQARAVARYAAGCLADAASGAGEAAESEAEVAASLAQAHCSGVAVRAAEECVQMHGGIGFTWEHPAHLYLKRAKSSAIALGTADRHRARLAALVDLPG